MDIRFSFQHSTALPERRTLRSFISQIFDSEGVPLSSLGFVFCSNDFLLKVNRDFLNHDYYTDIITFNLSEKEAASLTGEIYISVEMVRANAKQFGVSYKKELHRVIFHGVLHLCGYGDKTKAEKKQMTFMEDHYLKLYGL